jgi:cold shock CspA family protein
MRRHGTLVKWNEARGFGFIAVGQGGAEVFVHVSAFPRDGVAPQPGERVSFELVPGDGGRQEAVRVQRPGARLARPARPGSNREPLLSNKQGIAVSLLVLLLLGALGVMVIVSAQRQAPVAAPRPAPLAHVPEKTFQVRFLGP